MDPIMQQAAMQKPELNDEGKMAKADLYKTAKYALKLFKMMDDNAQLEGWVQAKITKAADYMASVYHYMEYEMKFSEYGQKLEMSDMYTAEEKRILKKKLVEAKVKMKELKKVQAQKIKKKTDESSMAKPGGVGFTPEKAMLDPRYKTDPAFKKEVDTAMQIGVQPKPTNPKYKGVVDNVPSPPDGATAPKNTQTREGKKLSKKDYDGDGKKESPKDEIWGARARAAAKAGNPFEEQRKAAKQKKQGGLTGPKSVLPEESAADDEGPEPKGGGGRKKGKGYDSETNVRKPPEGKVPFTSFHQGKQGDQAARLRATQVKGKLVKGQAQSAKQPKNSIDEEINEKGKCNHTPKGKNCPKHGMKECI
jgi:hypothetical protein